MYTKNCPICDSELIHKIYAGCYGTEEEYYNCPNKCYSYEFVYGNTTIYVGNWMTGYDYHIKPEDKKKIEEEIVMLCEYLNNKNQ